MQQEMLWAFFIIFAIDSITPGPAVAMVMSRGASVGLVRTLPFIAGLVVGDLALFVMALLGLAALATSFGTLFLFIKWIGIFYLLYLAYGAWTAKPSNAVITPTSGAGFRSFMLALVLPLGNPKAVGFYVALLPAFMDIEKLHLNTAIRFSLVIIVVWSAVLILYASLAAKGRRHLKNSSIIKWLNRCAAGCMVGAAGTIAFRD